MSSETHSTRSAARDERGDDSSRRADFGRNGRFPSPATSVELARVELRRGYRWLWVQDFWILFGIGVAAAFLFITWLAFDAFRDVGAALGAGEPVPSWVGLAWSVTWLFAVVISAWSGLSTESDLPNDGHYLTIRPVADVVGGHLIAAIGKFSLYVLPPAGGAALGLALGADSALPAVGIVAAALLVLVTAVVVGYPIGLAIKGLVRRSPTLSRYKSIVGLVLTVAYFGLAFSGRWIDLVDALEPLLHAPPLAWLTDFALVTTPGADVGALGAVAVIVLAAGIVAVGALLAPHPARYAWMADRQHHDEKADDVAVSAPAHRIDAVLESLCRAPATRGIASTTLLRAVRAPHQLVFVAFPLVFAIPVIEQLSSAGTLPWYVPWFVVWYGAWAGGVLVPLNPLGNQGATLPSLLTAPADGRHVVHGHVVAATVPIAPLTAALAVGAGYLAGRPQSELVALAVASVAAVAVGAVLAVGIGSVFPRFTAIDFADSTRAVPPSKVAYGVFSVGLSLAVVAAAFVADEQALEIGALVLSAWLSWGTTVSTDTLVTVSWALVGAAVVAVPIAYRLAVSRLGTYRLD
ncbi:hypothetical protein [Natronorubrum sp. FCH18a]|uniref:hypothetical protein n=1 Tax=Natronorubrum sp. FCH18a TaxID=3447018 RepID=UPI003F512CBA